MKKIIVSTLMLFGLFGFSQAAVLDDAVSWMNTNGLTIFKTTKDYQPNNYIRRDEAAKLFVKFAKIVEKDTYKKTAEECKFSDLNDAHADIKDIIVESCRMGIFQGANGKFMPTASLTNEQAIAVLVRIYDGYKSEEGVSYWSENYYEAAKTYTLFDQVPSMMNRREFATRGNVGVSIYTVQDFPGNYDEGYDFQSDVTKCTTDMINKQSSVWQSAGQYCEWKFTEQKEISKDKACAIQEDSLGGALLTTYGKEKTYTPWFYKNTNKLFYPVVVSSGGLWNDISSNFYVYDCKTKKATNLNNEFSSTENLNFGAQMDADGGFHVPSPMKLTQGKLLLTKSGIGLDVSSYYNVFDMNTLNNDYIDITTFKDYQLWSKSLPIHSNVARDGPVLENINKYGIGILSWNSYYSDGSEPTIDGKTTIDILNKTIIVNK